MSADRIDGSATGSGAASRRPYDHARRQVLSGWGRTDPAPATVVAPRTDDGAQRLLAFGSPRALRGLGRSYGDAAQLRDGLVVSTVELRGIDPTPPTASTNVFRVAAGTSIAELIDWGVPQGWFVPVTPGTTAVTIGGAIAADVHGKNHHGAGSFGAHVKRLRLITASNETVTCGPADDLFWATVGGMGLTGMILDADIAMQPISSDRVRVETVRTEDLAETMAVMVQTDADHEYSVAWIDLLSRGRSVLTQGRFATTAEASAVSDYAPPRSTSLPVPGLPKLTYTATVRAFNELWWRKAPRRRQVSLESIAGFFHPLDMVANWNLVYGKHGFIQWQFVVPDEAAETMVSIIKDLEALQAPAFFAVLKRFGPPGQGWLSFPKSGWTLALDLPFPSRSLGAALDRFDRQITEAGGRIYLAKDSRLDPALLPAMYPRLDEWRALRDRLDPGAVFRTDLSQRLGLTP